MSRFTRLDYLAELTADNQWYIVMLPKSCSTQIKENKTASYSFYFVNSSCRIAMFLFFFKLCNYKRTFLLLFSITFTAFDKM